MNSYQIFIVNEMTSEQEFFCFLSEPLVSGAVPGTIYANSNSYVSVVPNAIPFSSFTVPVQYVLSVDNSNQAVGLDIEVTTAMTVDVSLGDSWEAVFADPELHQAGTLQSNGSAPSSDTLLLATNSYPQGNEPTYRWFASETFGITTEQGFIGVTWAPSAGSATTIMPKLEFYIATGEFVANQLADMTTVSSTSQAVSLNDFDEYLQCTVTRTSSGTWSIAPGAPAQPSKSSTPLTASSSAAVTT